MKKIVVLIKTLSETLVSADILIYSSTNVITSQYTDTYDRCLTADEIKEDILPNDTDVIITFAWVGGRPNDR